MSKQCACIFLTRRRVGETSMITIPCDSCTEKESESPPEKKLKLQNEGEDDLKLEAQNLKNGDQNYDPSDWLSFPNKDEFIKYFQQVNDSDGFEFDKYPGSSLYTPIYPMRRYEDVPELEKEIRDYASMAISEHFQDGKERTVTEILRVNGECRRDFYYYITFKVNVEGEEEETFQAQVIETIEDTIEIPICRLKPN